MTPTPQRLLAPLLALAVAFEPALAAPLPAQAGTAPWHAFDYYTGNRFGNGEERLAVLLRARIDGTSCWLQLDTGDPAAVRWHAPRPADGAPASAPEPVMVTVHVGDVERTLPADAADLAGLRETPCGLVGTVGNAFFEHGTLALDFNEGRLAFAPGSALADEPAAQPMLYLRSGGPGGHPLLPATLPDGRRGHLLFDTGAARFGLAAFDAQGWRQLGGNRTLLRTFDARNVADVLACREAAYPESIALGTYAVAPGIVSYCEGRPFQLSQPLLGLLGLRAVGTRQVTLDYVAQRWLIGEPGRGLPGR